MSDHIFVGVAWPYANGPRHIGHVAGFGVPSDVFARYHRMRGDDVLMVSGTDEHGTPITVQADEEGVTPQALADRYNDVIVDDLRDLGLSYDLFTRTTTRNHYRVVQDVFKTLYEHGYIVTRTELGAFSADTGRALPDRYVEGTCPECGAYGARGDQCDSCGKQLDPVDLVDPRSRIDGKPPVFKESEQFFLDLPAFAEQLRAWIGSRGGWRPNVRSFSLNLLDDLRPRPITRDIDWGVPIPLPEYEQRDDKRIYVWFDAVIGYLSASLEWAEMVGDPEAWRRWWQQPDGRHLYFMGKDNIVFHSVIWPSMLLGYGEGGGVGAGRPLRLPENVVSSEFLTMEGRQFSSSRGVVIYVRDVLERYGADALRYFLTIAGPERQDTDFTWEEFVRRNNDELVATWGNLVNRTLRLAQQLGGSVPDPGPYEDADLRVRAAVEGGFTAVGEHIAATRFKAALAEAMRLAGDVNKYLSAQAPWSYRESDPVRCRTVVSTALHGVNDLKLLLAPFLPSSCERLHRLLGHRDACAPAPERAQRQEADGRSHTVLRLPAGQPFPRWQPASLPVGQPLPPPEPLFSKLDPSTVDAELARMRSAAAGA